MDTNLITADFNLKNTRQLLPTIIMLSVAHLFNTNIEKTIFDYNDIIETNLYKTGMYETYRGLPITMDLDNILPDIHTRKVFKKLYKNINQYITNWFCKSNANTLDLKAAMINDTERTLKLILNNHPNDLLENNFSSSISNKFCDKEHFNIYYELFNAIGCDNPYIDHICFLCLIYENPEGTVDITSLVDIDENGIFIPKNDIFIHNSKEYEEFIEMYISIGNYDFELRDLYYKKWASWVEIIMRKLYISAVKNYKSRKSI